MKKQALHWVCHSPSPYNDFLFRALAKSEVFQLQLHYLCAENRDSPWPVSSNRGYAFRSYRQRPLDWTTVGSVLADPKDVFLTSCWQDPTSELILTALMLLRRPYLVWNDTPSFRRRNWLKAWPRSKFLRSVFCRSAAVLGTGAPALAELARMGAPAEKLWNFPYCVDLDRFVPRQASETGEVIVLGTSSRLHRVKGLDVALRSLAQLARSSRRTFRYRIAGGGPEEYSLRAMVCDLGLADQVEFCGWVQPEDLPRFYHSLDAYLHPACFEPYGVAVIEALACGLPVMASDGTMAALDRSVSGRASFVHRAGDEADLLRTLEMFLNLSREHREEISRAARRAALSWTVEKAVGTIDRLVCEITEGAGSRAAARMEERA